MGYTMKLISIFVLVVLASCNFDANTVDPQASESITNSKRDGFFIEEFTVDKEKYCSAPGEAWVEYSWKNRLRYGKILKTTTFGRQLVLKIDPKKFDLDPYYYIETWELKDSIHNILGSSNGVYTIDLKNESKPKVFDIDLIRLQPTKSNLCKIRLTGN
jgi:hypothetical protein